MQIHTGITVGENGLRAIGLHVIAEEYDATPLTIVMSPELARQVAFSLMEEADRLEPPAWGGARHE